MNISGVGSIPLPPTTEANRPAVQAAPQPAADNDGDEAGESAAAKAAERGGVDIKV